MSKPKKTTICFSTDPQLAEKLDRLVNDLGAESRSVVLTAILTIVLTWIDAKEGIKNALQTVLNR